MKFIKGAVQGNPASLKIVGINDVQFGNPALDEDFLQRVSDYILANEGNTRVLVNGDIIEGIIKGSKGNIFKQTCSPKEQIDRAVDFFRPFSHLIDCIISGNHDQRIESETSLDPVEMICRYLGIEEKYGGYHSVIGYSWNKNFYSVEMFHGVGGATTRGAIEAKMKKIKRTNAHVMYSGHWHREFATPLPATSIDPFNGVLRDEMHWLVCGNTCMRTTEFNDKFGLEPIIPSQPVMEFSGKRRQKSIEVSWIR